MSQVDLPMTLGFGFWDKQKGPLTKAAKVPPTKLGDELKTLTRLHLAIDWKALAADKAALEDAAKGKIKALSEQAKSVLDAASRFETEAKKDRQFPKDPLTAAASIVKSAKEYLGDIEAAVAELRKALAAAQLQAAQKNKGSAAPAKPGAESKGAKLVRTRALEAIRKIRKPAPGAKPVRFFVVQGKLSVATYIGPSVGPTQEKLLKGLIPTEAPFKNFKDASGYLTWEKNALTFVSDVLPGSLVKKMQVWLKKILKLNLKLRVRRSDGAVEESEGEDLADDMLQPDAEELAAQQAAAREFEQRLTGLASEIRKAMTGPAGAEVKEIMASIEQHRKAGALVDASGDLDELEALLEAPETDGAGDAGAGEKAQALESWRVDRAAAIASLKQVATKVAAAKHPSSGRAIVEIQAVIKQLTGEPATLQQVKELQTWLETDDVVRDVSDMDQDIRTPLLRSLARLQGALAP